MNAKETASIKKVCVKKITKDTIFEFTDSLAVEEPLEIRLVYYTENKQIQKNISVTMRTPNNDKELAIGFLFTEGIISSYQAVQEVYHAGVKNVAGIANCVVVELKENIEPKLLQADRNFYTTSSCGVCGKGSIQAIKTVSCFQNLPKSKLTITPELFYELPQKLRNAQNTFDTTGGIHAAGLFNLEGELQLLREDVGRHNALDKLIGVALSKNLLPLKNYILVLSGRASFELIQKAAMAGISIVAAIGAPSSLAVEVAKEFDITLLGFLRETHFNCYHSSDNITMLIKN